MLLRRLIAKLCRATFSGENSSREDHKCCELERRDPGMAASSSLWLSAGLLFHRPYALVPDSFNGLLGVAAGILRASAGPQSSRTCIREPLKGCLGRRVLIADS
jgi:hypothetical protein